MPVSFAVDRAAGCVWARAKGSLTEADVLEALSRLAEHPDFRAGMPQLFDLRDVSTVRLGSPELRSVATLAAELSEKLGVGKLAVLGDRPVLYGLARMYEVFTDGLGVKVRAFQDEQEARTWLGLPESASPPR